jgi:N-acetylmuramoyl-L-alanine amidase
MFSRFFSLLICLSIFMPRVFSQEPVSPLVGKIICVDAGHGGTALTDSYRVGPSGEREEWVNLRVALILQKLLEEKGAKVIMTRIVDEHIPLAERAQIAKDGQADLFLSIHHNATADPKVNFPIVYFGGNASENKASVALGQAIAKAIKEKMFVQDSPVSVVSDHTIFPTAGASVLRETYGIPGVVAEASFFTNADEEGRLKQAQYNQQEALGYLAALEDFFSKPVPKILDKNSLVYLKPFPVFQEAERMSPEAQLWHQDFVDGEQLMKRKNKKSLLKAYDLFTRSARSFPDSYVARKCHENRVIILKKLGKVEEAQQAQTRVSEFFTQ